MNDLLASNPDRAKDLKKQLPQWANTLSPPGFWALKSEGMSRQADAYFDWYVEADRTIEAQPPRKKSEDKR